MGNGLTLFFIEYFFESNFFGGGGKFTTQQTHKLKRMGAPYLAYTALVRLREKIGFDVMTLE